MQKSKDETMLSNNEYFLPVKTEQV